MKVVGLWTVYYAKMRRVVVVVVVDRSRTLEMDVDRDSREFVVS